MFPSAVVVVLASLLMAQNVVIQGGIRDRQRKVRAFCAAALVDVVLIVTGVVWLSHTHGRGASGGDAAYLLRVWLPLIALSPVISAMLFLASPPRWFCASYSDRMRAMVWLVWIFWIIGAWGAVYAITLPRG